MLNKFIEFRLEQLEVYDACIITYAREIMRLRFQLDAEEDFEWRNFIADSKYKFTLKEAYFILKEYLAWKRYKTHAVKEDEMNTSYLDQDGNIKCVGCDGIMKLYPINDNKMLAVHVGYEDDIRIPEKWKEDKELYSSAISFRNNLYWLKIKEDNVDVDREAFMKYKLQLQRFKFKETVSKLWESAMEDSHRKRCKLDE